MLTILAPSKTMDVSTIQLPIETHTPYFLQQSSMIVAAVKMQPDIATFMKVSSSIASEVVDMYRLWDRSPTKACAFMYKGDVYKGFYASTLSRDDIVWMQDHLMIASGLYGLLRPFDEIAPYRLEMRAHLSIGSAKNLYEFWTDKLALYADEYASGVICILSSEEYARPIRKYSTSRIVTPVFMDHKPNGTVGQVPIYSKMMRGVMARWIIDHRIDSPADLIGFDRFGYMYDAERSKADAPVFVREKMTPLVF